MQQSSRRFASIAATTLWIAAALCILGMVFVGAADEFMLELRRGDILSALLWVAFIASMLGGLGWTVYRIFRPR